jgi:hypothetical protein
MVSLQGNTTQHQGNVVVIAVMFVSLLFQLLLLWCLVLLLHQQCKQPTNGQIQYPEIRITDLKNFKQFLNHKIFKVVSYLTSKSNLVLSQTFNLNIRANNE